MSLKDKKLVWVKIPIERSDFIPVLTNLGFEFHHCDEKNLMLIKKMAYDSYVPTTKNFIVGVFVVKAAINNKELKLTEQQIKLRVPDGEVFFQ